MIPLLPRRRPLTTLLGLSLEGDQLEGVVLRRVNGSLQVAQTFTVPLALSLTTGDPELLGREIRNHLDQAGVRERDCAFCVPLSWALVLQTRLPELPEADQASFLDIEAERGFPYGTDALAIARSFCRPPGGAATATQVAIPREPLARLAQVLKAAKLKPVTFSLGVAALQPAVGETAEGVLALVLGESTLGLQVTSGGGVAALRTLEGAVETEGGQKRLQADLVMREIRITLGQLPAPVRRVRVFGPAAMTRQLVDEIRPRLEAMGLDVERVTGYAAGEFGVELPAGTIVSPAFSLAANHLVGRRGGFEFLPARVQPWEQWLARYPSKKLAWAGAAAGSVALVVVLAFLVQQWQLMRLQSKWDGMAMRVTELDGQQQLIRKFRPWFDESMSTLSILRRLAEAFPEDGVVTAKTVEIRELATVTCSGTARDSQTLLKALERLRAAQEVTDVKVDQIRGKSPVQFTFNFHWSEGGAQ